MLWAITSYFNPVGYASRRHNFRIFRDNLCAPLVAVELSIRGQFELERNDADILVQIDGSDILWQKERLLNIALAHLPRQCEHVAWVDCDVVFADHDWVERASHALERLRLIQLFRERCNLPPGTQPSWESDGHCDSMAESVGYRIATGTAEPDDFRHSDAPLARKTTVGLAWAARRDLLCSHSLYDACILGSGDRAILCAATGTFDYGIDATAMRGHQIEHYLNWARPFHYAVAGRVGFIDGCLFHLWHGALKDRRYGQRLDGLGRFEFNPFTDIGLSPSGAWQWRENKPEMHDYVRRYFESRKEDG